MKEKPAFESRRVRTQPLTVTAESLGARRDKMSRTLSCWEAIHPILHTIPDRGGRLIFNAAIPILRSGGTGTRKGAAARRRNPRRCRPAARLPAGFDERAGSLDGRLGHAAGRSVPQDRGPDQRG